MTTEAQALEALSSAAAEIESAGQRKDLAESLTSICETYKKIRPKIVAALTLIDLIPVYGKKIGIAVRFLMTVADAGCALK